MKNKALNVPALLTVVGLAGGLACASQAVLAAGSNLQFPASTHAQTPEQRARAIASTQKHRARQRAATRSDGARQQQAGKQAGTRGMKKSH